MAKSLRQHNDGHYPLSSMTLPQPALTFRSPYVNHLGKKGASYIYPCILFILYHPTLDLALSFKNTSQKFDKSKTKHESWPPLCLGGKCQLIGRNPIHFFFQLEKRSAGRTTAACKCVYSLSIKGKVFLFLRISRQESITSLGSSFQCFMVSSYC